MILIEKLRRVGVGGGVRGGQRGASERGGLERGCPRCVGVSAVIASIAVVTEHTFDEFIPVLDTLSNYVVQNATHPSLLPFLEILVDDSQ